MIKAERTELQFFNKYGLVYEDCFYVIKDDCPMCFNLNEVKKINFETKQEYKLNWVIFSTSFLLGIASFYLFYDLLLIKITGFSLALFLFVFSLLYKKHNYRLLIVTINCHLMSIKVDIDFKNEANEISSRIGEKLRIKKDN